MGAAGCAVAAAALLPVAYLVVRASEAGAAGMLDIATNDRSVGLLIRSGLLAVLVAVTAVGLGVPLAWLTVRSDLPLRRMWSVVLALPLAIPSFIGGYAFVAALGPKGMVQGWLAPLGVERLPEIYGLFGAWLLISLLTYPYVFLTVRAALRRLDPALEEASASLGRDRRRTFLRVVLPQLRAAMTSGALLAALYALSDFGAVSLLRFNSFTRAIFFQYKASFDRTPAAVLSLVLVVLTGAVLAAELRSRGRAAYHRSSAGTRRAVPTVSLGRWRWPAFAGCLALAVIGLGIPLGVTGYWLGRGISQGQTLGFTWTAARHSLEASALGGGVAVAAAWPVAWLSVRHRGRVSGVVEASTWIGHALPGVVIALSLVFFGARYALDLYQTRTMLVFAYVVLFLPIAVGAIRSSLLQVSPSLDEAARSLGSSRLEAWRRVLAPLVAPGVGAGFALVFLTAMKELPATLLLAPTGYSTLATEVWSAASSVFFARAAVPAIALIVLASVPLALLTMRERES